MTDCNACLIGAEADGYCEVFNRRDQRSRKTRRCCECGRAIAIGDLYEYTFTVFEGEAAAFATCLICAEIRDAYYCGEESNAPLIEGLWIDIMEEEFFSRFTTACLGKLKTPAAKAYMVERWQKWRGLRK